MPDNTSIQQDKDLTVELGEFLDSQVLSSEDFVTKQQFIKLAPKFRQNLEQFIRDRYKDIDISSRLDELDKAERHCYAAHAPNQVIINSGMHVAAFGTESARMMSYFRERGDMLEKLLS